MYKTTDVANNSYAQENNTNQTTISINEDLKPVNMSSMHGLQGMNNTFGTSSTSNYSRFFDDHTKVKTNDDFKTHRRGERSMNISALRSKQGHSMQGRALQNVKRAGEFIDPKLLFKVNEVLKSSAKYNYKINFKHYEQHWKTKEEEIDRIKFSEEEIYWRKKHIFTNKGFSMLFNSLKVVLPDLTKTTYKLVNELNEIISHYQE